MHRHSFSVGDAVYFLNKSSRKGVSKKLQPVWSGPGIILTCYSPWTFQVRVKNREVKTMNHDMLKKCTDGSLPLWIVREQKAIRGKAQIEYCFCGKPDNGGLMIQCEGCDEWLHGSCVGIRSERQAKGIKEYWCPTCST